MSEFSDGIGNPNPKNLYPDLDQTNVVDFGNNNRGAGAQHAENAYALHILQGNMTIDAVPNSLRAAVQVRVDNPPPSVVAGLANPNTDDADAQAAQTTAPNYLNPFVPQGTIFGTAQNSPNALLSDGPEQGVTLPEWQPVGGEARVEEGVKEGQIEAAIQAELALLPPADPAVGFSDTGAPDANPNLGPDFTFDGNIINPNVDLNLNPNIAEWLANNPDFTTVSPEAIAEFVAEQEKQRLADAEKQRLADEAVQAALQESSTDDSVIDGVIADTAGDLPLTKDLILDSIQTGETEIVDYTQEQLDTLGISTEDLNRAQLDEEGVKGQVVEAIKGALGDIGGKALEVADDFFNWLLKVLDPTNIPGIGIKVNATTGNIEFGVLNIPGLIFGTLNTTTGVLSTSGGNISLGGGGQGGTPPGAAPGEDPDDTLIDDVIDDGSDTTDNTAGGTTDDDTTDDTTSDTTGGLPDDTDTDEEEVVVVTEEEEEEVVVVTEEEEDDDDPPPPPGEEEEETEGMSGVEEFWDKWGEKILGGASAAASAAINISGLDKAAEKALEGVIAGIDFQRETFDEIRADLAPFIGAGTSTADAAAQHALGEFTADQIDLTGAVPENTSSQGLPDISGAPTIGAGPTPTPGLNVEGLTEVGALAPEDPRNLAIGATAGEQGVTAGGVTTGGEVPVNQFDPFDPNDPVLRFLQDESRRQVESSAAVKGSALSGGTLSELNREAQNVSLLNAGRVQDIATQRDTLSLQANSQAFNQQLGAASFNFASASQFRNQLSGEDRQAFELDAAKRGILFNESQAVNQAQLAQRVDEFTEQVIGQEMTFNQETAFRQQLNAEEQQLWDILKSNRAQLVEERNIQFQQDQVQFEDQFNMNAQDFQQALNMDANQFHQLIQNSTLGANAAAMKATNATNLSMAQADLMAANGFAQAGVSMAQSQQLATGITEIVDLLMGNMGGGVSMPAGGIASMRGGSA